MPLWIKIVLFAGVLVVVAATFFADYQWRRWMNARRREHDPTQKPPL